MDSRNLLMETEKVEVLIDSASFDSLIAGGNRVALAILGQHNSQVIDFVRTPWTTIIPELQSVPEYAFELDGSSWIRGLSISTAIMIWH